MLMDTTSFTKKSLGLETAEPALTPPTGKAATLPKKPKMGGGKSKKARHPRGAVDQVSQVQHDGFRQGTG